MAFNRSLSYVVDALTEQIEDGHPADKQLRKARELVLSACLPPVAPWWKFWRAGRVQDTLGSTRLNAGVPSLSGLFCGSGAMSERHDDQ